jgi:nitrogen fixation protein FixH
MKFNWGTGIFIFITLFILAVVAFIIYASNLDIKMVEDNYYDRELAYQERIDRLNNTAALPWKVSIEQGPGIIRVQFPILERPAISTGKLLLYRPSDPAKDFSVPLQLNDSSSQDIDIKGIDKGKWIIKMDWMMDGKGYYFEKEVFIEQ